MADLGDLIGSLMVGMIRARRMADEQTAALAEYYKTNPVLEGLSVPRIRVPELTIDMPVLIENHVEGEEAEAAKPEKITEAVLTQLETTLAEHHIKAGAELQAAFKEELHAQLVASRKLPGVVTREKHIQIVQSALDKALKRSNTHLSAEHKNVIHKDLRAVVAAVSVTKETVTPSIVANIKTADVKEKASNATIVRVRITMKEEGLEWATQTSETGGIVRTLTPE